MLNESVISTKISKFITTNKIIKFININVKSNECNICMNNFNLDYFGCPKIFKYCMLSLC